jgi:hypothetical protein
MKHVSGMRAEGGPYIRHVYNDNAAVLLNAIGHATNTSFENVVAVEEGHLGGGLDPYLVLCVLLGGLGRGKTARPFVGDVESAW